MKTVIGRVPARASLSSARRASRGNGAYHPRGKGYSTRAPKFPPDAHARVRDLTIAAMNLTSLPLPPTAAAHDGSGNSVGWSEVLVAAKECGAVGGEAIR